MNRQQVLVGLLIVVAVTMLPVYFLERSMATKRKELAALEEQMQLLRDKVAAVKSLEEELAEAAKAEARVAQRLIGSDPFADMHRELNAAATRAGLQINQLSLSGGKPVQGLPFLEYQATVDVAGSVDSFAQYLRLLEQHRLLIGIPDLQMHLPRLGEGFVAPSPIRTSLSLQFYGKGPAPGANSKE